MNNTPVLMLHDVSRSFHQGTERLDILSKVKLSVQPGELVALVGPSGSGKSTLLHIAGLLEQPSSGRIAICGEAAENASDARRTQLRRRFMGFVYQYHHLLPEFSALENVVMPQIIAGSGRKAARERAKQLLSAVGLSQRLSHRPARLSGGEQQRVALARALANKPRLLLADEPTGNLDPHHAEEVFSLLLQLARAENLGALIATHNLDLARRMDRGLRIDNGHIVSI